MGEHIHSKDNKSFEEIVVNLMGTYVMEITFDVIDEDTLEFTVRDDRTTEVLFQDKMKAEHQPDFDYISKTMELEFEDIEAQFKKWDEAGRPTELKEDSVCSLSGEELDFLKFIESPAFAGLGGDDMPGMNGMPDMENLSEEDILKLLQQEFGDGILDDVMNIDNLYGEEGYEGVPEFDDHEDFDKAFKEDL